VMCYFYYTILVCRRNTSDSRSLWQTCVFKRSHILEIFHLA